MRRGNLEAISPKATDKEEPKVRSIYIKNMTAIAESQDRKGLRQAISFKDKYLVYFKHYNKNIFLPEEPPEKRDSSPENPYS